MYCLMICLIIYYVADYCYRKQLIYYIFHWK